MDEDLDALRGRCAAGVKALVDAIRAIPPELAPVRRASTQAVREQIYHGFERPLARARGGPRLWGKYEQDRAWSVAAVDLVRSGRAVCGQRMLNRDHVWEAALIVSELLGEERSVSETAELLESRLVTCTVLAEEHALLGRVSRDVVGWDRYRVAGVAIVETFPPSP